MSGVLAMCREWWARPRRRVQAISRGFKEPIWVQEAFLSRGAEKGLRGYIFGRITDRGVGILADGRNDEELKNTGQSRPARKREAKWREEASRRGREKERRRGRE